MKRATFEAPGRVLAACARACASSRHLQKLQLLSGAEFPFRQSQIARFSCALRSRLS